MPTRFQRACSLFMRMLLAGTLGLATPLWAAVAIDVHVSVDQGVENCDHSRLLNHVRE